LDSPEHAQMEAALARAVAAGINGLSWFAPAIARDER
jgi:hypothetical protein